VGLYLSLTIAGQFLAFQWDNLLLETGFLAIFAPGSFGETFSPRHPDLVMVSTLALIK
jgi:hypothetical protein